MTAVAVRAHQAQATQPPQFVLASGSPRRRSYLADAGYRFVVDASDVEEVPAAGETAEAYAMRVATAKARAAAERHPDLPVLGADTDVVLDGRVLGKPRDADEAVAMLLALAGRRHEVISAVALIAAGRERRCLSRTEVEFIPLSEAAARAYADTGEPLDKAGAYAIQGGAARFVRSIHGSYTGIVGLPLAETCELLAVAGIHSSIPFAVRS